MPEEIEKTQDKLQNSWYLGGDSKQVPSEYKNHTRYQPQESLCRDFLNEYSERG
jgi:hypothetical protein